MEETEVVVSKLAPPTSDCTMRATYRNVRTGVERILLRGMTRATEVQHILEVFPDGCYGCVGIICLERCENVGGSATTSERWTVVHSRSQPNLYPFHGGLVCDRCREAHIDGACEHFRRELDRVGAWPQITVHREGRPELG